MTVGRFPAKRTEYEHVESTVDQFDSVVLSSFGHVVDSLLHWLVVSLPSFPFVAHLYGGDLPIKSDLGSRLPVTFNRS